MDSNSPTKLNIGKAGWGCLILFLLPFCAIGIFAALKAVLFFISGDVKQGLFLSLFATVFGGAGFGLLVAARFGAKKQKEIDALKLVHPDAPWMWRKDWAQGWIASTGKKGAWAAWVFALLWNAISTPLLFMVSAELDKGQKMVLIALLFPLVGIGLLIHAVRTTIALKKFGDSIFKMPHVPGVIGGSLSGVIEMSTKVRPEDGFHLRLSCVHSYTSGSGDDRSTHEDVLWEDEKIIIKDLLGNDSGRTAIPVFFQIPHDCRPAERENYSGGIIWKLEVKAKVTGLDYKAQFEVPVFKTEQSTEELVAINDPTAPFQAPLESFAPSADSRIKVHPDATGGLELVFPAALNPGVGFSIAVFTLIFVGATWFLASVKAPIIFPIVFGLFDLLLILILVDVCLKSCRVNVNTTRISVTKRWLFFSRTTEIPNSEIGELSLYAGMRSGSKAWYDIRIRKTNGRKITAASGIHPKQQADWLLQQIENAMAGSKTVSTTDGHG